MNSFTRLRIISSKDTVSVYIDWASGGVKKSQFRWHDTRTSQSCSSDPTESRQLALSFPKALKAVSKQLSPKGREFDGSVEINGQNLFLQFLGILDLKDATIRVWHPWYGRRELFVCIAKHEIQTNGKSNIRRGIRNFELVHGFGLLVKKGYCRLLWFCYRSNIYFLLFTRSMSWHYIASIDVIDVPVLQIRPLFFFFLMGSFFTHSGGENAFCTK